jgi:hypothetical protein
MTQQQPADAGPEVQPLETVDHDHLDEILLVPRDVAHLTDCAHRWLSCQRDDLIELERRR